MLKIKKMRGGGKIKYLSIYRLTQLRNHTQTIYNLMQHVPFVEYNNSSPVQILYYNSLKKKNYIIIIGVSNNNSTKILSKKTTT